MKLLKGLQVGGAQALLLGAVISSQFKPEFLPVVRQKKKEKRTGGKECLAGFLDLF